VLLLIKIIVQITKNKIQKSICYNPEGSDRKAARLNVGELDTITMVQGASARGITLSRRPVVRAREKISR